MIFNFKYFDWQINISCKVVIRSIITLCSTRAWICVLNPLRLPITLLLHPPRTSVTLILVHFQYRCKNKMDKSNNSFGRRSNWHTFHNYSNWFSMKSLWLGAQRLSQSSLYHQPDYQLLYHVPALQFAGIGEPGCHFYIGKFFNHQPSRLPIYYVTRISRKQINSLSLFLLNVWQN